jgi:biotin operon repressor
MPDDNEKDQLRARIRDLELTLGQGDDNLAVTFRLTPVLNNLLGLLLSLPVVTPEMIRQRLEIAPDAKVAVHRLRKHLEPWGLAIESKRNVGYWLEHDAKTKIRELMADTLSGNLPSLSKVAARLQELDSEQPDEDDLSEAA